MTSAAKSIRTLIGTAAILAVTSLASAYAGESTSLAAQISAQANALPGAASQINPCGPKKISSPLGY